MEDHNFIKAALLRIKQKYFKFKIKKKEKIEDRKFDLGYLKDL